MRLKIMRKLFEACHTPQPPLGSRPSSCLCRAAQSAHVQRMRNLFYKRINKNFPKTKCNKNAKRPAAPTNTYLK